MNFELLTEENFDKLTKKQQREYLPAKVEEFVQLMISSSKVTTMLINPPPIGLQEATRGETGRILSVLHPADSEDDQTRTGSRGRQWDDFDLGLLSPAYSVLRATLWVNINIH